MKWDECRLVFKYKSKMNNLPPSVFGIQSTAGAVPVRNEKGK